jgi:hypothetical protein
LKTNEVNINRSTIVCLFGKDIKKFIRFVLMGKVVAKPNKEKIVNEILFEMDLGITYVDCLALNQTKWRMPTSTFARYWKEALLRITALNELTQNAFNEIYVEGRKEALRRHVLTRLERQEILTAIAKGEILIEKPVVAEGMIQMIEVAPALADRKNAIAELNKMDGEYAPVKKDVTSNGETIRIDFTD